MAISAAQVKVLRDRTGARMMECKRALEASDGDIEKAIEYMRKKGAATAEKRTNRATNQGLVEAYIHAGGRLGAIVEVNCETDFVAKTDDFRTIARDVAMQIAAMSPMVITREQVDSKLVERELEIYRTQSKNEGKPDHIVDRIANGRLEKYFQEVVLLEQSFIKDPGKTIKDVLNDAIAKLGEKITIRRFHRFHLGEDNT
ncbi:MAG: translation elongation factor Ts [Bacteroidota bacterium]